MILLDPRARPLIAHRGASGEYPENTLLAFAEGLRQGADGLELDVRLTADGVPVVIHDDTVERTTDGTGYVADFTADALRELDAGRGERIPTLAEVVERFPGTPLVLEIKEARAAGGAAEVLIHHAAQSRVVVGSFAHGALARFHGLGWLRAASRRETAWFWAASRIGLPRWPGRYQALTVPERHGQLSVVDERFLRLARRLGKPVHVWTVNTRLDAERLWALGVSGIITDYPARIRPVGC